ncbi:MAG: nucleoid occlusion factor SlmA [Chloroflexota bacterium]
MSFVADERRSSGRCEKVLLVLLGFSDRNPGISRILMGDALTGETDRLRTRIGQFFDRVETQFKQIVREGQASAELSSDLDAAAAANLLLALAEGRINQFVRSGFKRSPLERWESQWEVLQATLFRPAEVPA